MKPRHSLYRYRHYAWIAGSCSAALLIGWTAYAQVNPQEQVRQDTIATTNGLPAQEHSMLPPPTPPTATNAQSQNITPPAPPNASTPGQVNQAGEFRSHGGAQLGIFMFPSEGPGLRVSSVTIGSAAATAGLRAGDFLLAVDGQAVETPNEVTQIVRKHNPGDVVELRVWRDNAEQTIAATLQELRPAVAPSSALIESPGFYDEIVGGYVYPGPRVYQRSFYSPGVNYYVPADRYGYQFGGAVDYPYYGNYYGTPNFGYYNSTWGEGVRVGGLQFGWR